MPVSWSRPAYFNEGENPYVNWWNYIEEDRKRLFVPRTLSRPLWHDFSANNWGKGDDMAKNEFGGGEAVPIPAHAARGSEDKLPDWDDIGFPAQLPDVPDDLVIIGIIDTGIALGHRRFRRKDGSTRFLASWQQTSKWMCDDQLPCGQELYHDGIDKLLCQHSGGALDGRLDEEAFNRVAHLVEPEQPIGHRDLDYRAAHGTHVLDLATGFGPVRTDASTLDKYRIIAVNLPPQYVHGSAGNFLAFFAIFGLERILCLADALWRGKNPGKKRGGYPVVVNFSYGMNAGPKDGGSSWERAMHYLLVRRARRTRAPTRLVMPVGNENLERGTAVTLMGKGKWEKTTKEYPLEPEVSLPWRIRPSDQTSNHIEIWASGVEKERPTPTPGQFELFVTPPGRPRLRVPYLRPGEYSSLDDYARVYRPRTGTEYPLHLVICVAPTLRYSVRQFTAPAGNWDITVCYDEMVPVDVAFYVQSDQPTVRDTQTGGQSYFDHPSYRINRADGRLHDSFDYPTGENEEPWDKYGPVQRKGSHNALSTGHGVGVVGGYRLTDGRPALYSATTSGDRWRNQGRDIIDALYPTDDGAAHFGLLGAGSRDGSVTTFQGTSMAAAQATRDIAAEFARCISGRSNPAPGCASPKWLRKRAGAYKKGGGRPLHYHDVDGLKGGAGHLPLAEALAEARVRRVRAPDDV